MTIEELRQYKEMLKPSETAESLQKEKEYVVVKLDGKEYNVVMLNKRYTLKEIEESFDNTKAMNAIEDAFKNSIKNAPTDVFYNSIALQYSPCFFCEYNIAKKIVDKANYYSYIWSRDIDRGQNHSKDYYEGMKEFRKFLHDNISNNNILIDYFPFVISYADYWQWKVYASADPDDSSMVFPDNNTFYEDFEYELDNIISGDDILDDNVYITNYSELMKVLEDAGIENQARHDINDNSDYLNLIVDSISNDDGPYVVEWSLVADFRKIKPKSEDKQL